MLDGASDLLLDGLVDLDALEPALEAQSVGVLVVRLVLGLTKREAYNFCKPTI